MTISDAQKLVANLQKALEAHELETGAKQAEILADKARVDLGKEQLDSIAKRNVAKMKTMVDRVARLSR